MDINIAKLYWDMLIDDGAGNSNNNKNIFNNVGDSLIGFNKKNKTDFLSNFYPSSVAFEGTLYSTVEHAYQASKTLNKQSRQLIKKANSPYEAKKLGKSLQLRSDWSNVRIDIMRGLIKEKFENPFLGYLLLSTKDFSLINENSWNDKFWGVSGGVGENWLGRILEEVRNELKKESTEMF